MDWLVLLGQCHLHLGIPNSLKQKLDKEGYQGEHNHGKNICFCALDKCVVHNEYWEMLRGALKSFFQPISVEWLQGSPPEEPEWANVE